MRQVYRNKRVLCGSIGANSPDLDPVGLTPGSLRPGLSRHHWESEELLLGETGASSPGSGAADLIMTPAVRRGWSDLVALQMGETKSRTQTRNRATTLIRVYSHPHTP